MKLVLASGSQRRRELLTMCGYDYEIIVSNADETIDENDPESLNFRFFPNAAFGLNFRFFPNAALSGGVFIRDIRNHGHSGENSVGFSGQH